MIPFFGGVALSAFRPWPDAKRSDAWSGGRSLRGTCHARFFAIRNGRPLQVARRLIVAIILIASCGTAAADSLVQIYAIRGFAGVAFSRGMNQLCDDLVRIPQVSCAVEDYHDESAIISKAAGAAATGRRLVLVGHSWGAHAALHVAAAMNVDVPLIVTIDPNWFPTPPLVPRNAGVVLNYYQDMDVLGRATLQPSPAFRGTLNQYRLNEPHVLIDRDPEIHREIITRVRALASQNPPPSKRGPTQPNPEPRRR
jgi:Alpha/beta hydrolase family